MDIEHLASGSRSNSDNANLRLALACSALALGIISSLSFLSYDAVQVKAAHTEAYNVCGQLGAWFAHFCIGSWGLAAFLIPVVCIGFGLVFFHHRPKNIGLRLTGWTMLLFSLSGLLQLCTVSPSHQLLYNWDQNQFRGLGGRLGFFLCGSDGLLYSALGTWGSACVLILTAALSTLLLRLGVVRLSKRVARGIRSYQERKAQALRPTPRKAAADASVAVADDPEPAAADDAPSSQHLPAQPARPTTIDDVNKKLVEREKESTTDAGSAAHELVDRIRKRRAEIAAESSGQLPSIGDSEKQDWQKSPKELVIHHPDNKEKDAAADMADSKTDDRPADKAADAELGSAVTNEPAQERVKLDVEGAAAGTKESPHKSALRKATGAEKPASKANAAAKAAATSPAKAKAADKPAQAIRKKSKTKYEDYVLPAETVLEESPEKNIEGANAETNRTAGMIEEIFESFKVRVKVVSATRGPVITQYELELLDAGMRVNKVANLEQELCLNLGTEGVRIVAPLPNRKTIGVEVPNSIKELVVMRDLVEETNIDDYRLPLIIGRDVLGKAMVGDLTKMPHLLVAGATGMGKSVCLNAIICSVLLFRDPDDVKFILVDPKMVELAPYEDIPHLLTPPITDMTKAHAALEWACKTMDERYFALRMAGVRDIGSYNKLGEKEILKRLEKKGKTIEDLPGGETHMPYIIIVVDEYADLMMVNKEVEKSIVRLTAKSRACGIHIILTTQRPSADIVTGLIKSNLPSRIAFRVADKNNSRVVLDCGGAENLIGKGDMLYLAPGTSSPVRGQGVWVKDPEIDAIIDHVREQGEPEYNENIINVGAIAMAGGGSSNAKGGHDWVNDRQFHEAVHMMYTHERSGADFLRRKLAIGYNKATTFVETLEDLGFLSAQNGTRPREFLQSWEDWIDLLNENGVQRDEYDEIYQSPH